MKMNLKVVAVMDSEVDTEVVVVAVVLAAMEEDLVVMEGSAAAVD